jgi:DNA-directed RNA polymerase subunit M/transcription elongation factor TFIIS
MTYCPECGSRIRPDEDGTLSCLKCEWVGSTEQIKRREVATIREADPSQGKAMAIMAVKEIMAPLIASMANMAEAIGGLKEDLGGIRQEMRQVRQDRQESRNGATPTSVWDEHERNFQQTKKGGGQ